MPNTSAAKRALRQSGRKAVLNLRKKRELLGVIKDYKKTAAAGDMAAAATKLPGVFKKLDKAARTNLIKKGRAARLKSRLSKKLVPTSIPESSQ